MEGRSPISQVTPMMIRVGGCPHSDEKDGASNLHISSSLCFCVQDERRDIIHLPPNYSLAVLCQTQRYERYTCIVREKEQEEIRRRRPLSQCDCTASAPSSHTCVSWLLSLTFVSCNYMARGYFRICCKILGCALISLVRRPYVG